MITGMTLSTRQFVLPVAGSAYTLEAVCVECGEDLVVVVGGGSRHHIGAVGLTISLPSLKDAGKLTQSTYQVPVPGHKEEALARQGSRLLSQRLGRNVVLSVGMHEDDLSKEGIQAYVDAFDALVEHIAQAYAASP